MANCNDCIHRKVCVILAFPEAFENTEWEKEPCDHFKDADVVPKSEVEKIFEKLKRRECSACVWCVHATACGKRNEECDKPYIDKNGKEQRACYVYAKFESLIDNELSELKKKYTEGKK